MLDIVLVRHGEAAASWGQAADPGLSAAGQQQAAGAAESLREQVGAAVQIVSSPLLRAVQTAQPLARLIQKPVHQDAAFSEIPAPVSLPQRQQWLQQFMQQQWSGQDPVLLAWRARAQRHLLQLNQPTVVFTHFLLINAIVGVLLEQSATVCFWPANASITRIRHTGSALELVALGQAMKTVVN